MATSNQRSNYNTYVAAGQITLGICVVICLYILPGYFFSGNQGGISNYGTDSRTRWLFVLGFSAAGLGTALASYRLRMPTGATSKLRPYRLGLAVLSLLYFLVMLSTFSYKLSPTYRRLHEQAAILLFLGMLVVAIWLYRDFQTDKFVRLAFIVFMIGLLLALLSFTGLLHMLFTAQLLAGASFGYILARCLSKIPRLP